VLGIVIYLDYNATTPVSPQVVAEMRPYLEEFHGNPSSIHSAGRRTRAAIDDSRDRMARILGAKSHEVIFTGGGTESDNLAILGLARRRASEGKGKHIITCATEHHAILHAFEWLAFREGFQVTILPVGADGRLEPARLADAISTETTLVSVMSANNETGVRQPVSELAAICKKHGALFHTDAIQTFGKELLPALGQSDFDAVSLAAHKFYGPKGVGLLWLRGGISIDRTSLGGSHEGDRRAGTENVAGIVGMACAAELSVESIPVESERLGELRERLWRGVSGISPEVRRNGRAEDTLANTLNVSFPGLDGESLHISLDLAGLCVSSGSACMVGSIQPSHVLLAMGVEPEVAQATVRFSLGKMTTEAEVDETIRRIGPVIDRLRSC
jgi:cysteine desulfurase